MRYIYAYNTKDNERREATIVASSVDDAFKALRAQGVKPIRVTLAPGLLNKVQSLGKRWLAIVVLSAIALGALLVANSYKRVAESNVEAQDLLSATMRRQLFGDMAVIEKGIKTGWADVFEHEGERFLASFAIPGVPAGQRTATVEEIQAALGRSIAVHPDDPIETKQIKSMVEGMKAEAREFIADGGSIKRYGQRLVQRQEMELMYYSRVKNEIDRLVKDKRPADEIERVWEERNAMLRRMGIKLVAMPEL